MAEPDLVDASGNIKAHASLLFSIPVSRAGEEEGTLLDLTDSVIVVNIDDVGIWELPLGEEPTDRIFSIPLDEMSKMDIDRKYKFLISDQTVPTDPVRMWSGTITLDGFR